MQNDWPHILSRVTLISQLGLSFVLPPLLLLLGALWMQSRFGIGDWILLCAILCGCVSGGCAVYNLIRAEVHREEKQTNKSNNREEDPHETGSRR